MGEGVVADLVAFGVDALNDAAEFFSLDADDEKCGGDVLVFEDVEDAGGPLGIGAVIEGERQLILAGAVTRHAIRLREGCEILVVDEAGIFVDADLALPIGGLGFDVQDFAAAFHVDVLAGRHVFQVIGGIGFAGDVPHAPQ